MNRLLFGSAFSRVDRARASGRFRFWSTSGNRVGTLGLRLARRTL